MAAPKSDKTKLTDALKQLQQARALLQCQLFMEVQLPETMKVAIEQFLNETK